MSDKLLLFFIFTLLQQLEYNHSVNPLEIDIEQKLWGLVIPNVNPYTLITIYLFN